MVLFRGANPIGPANRDERGAYEEMDKRVIGYMKMDDEEWDVLYEKMYNDRKYPGQNNLKAVVIPTFVYTFFASTFTYELYRRRASLFSASSNLVKLLLIPLFGVLTFRNLDVGLDIIKYRNILRCINLNSFY